MPAHLAESFASGVLINAGLSPADILKMATATLQFNEHLNPSKAFETAKSLSPSEARQVAAQPFLIEYYELPIAEFRKTGEFHFAKSSYLDWQKSQSPLLFRRNEEDWIRWFVHPLRMDTRYKVITGHANSPRSGRFLAQMTESRSLLLFDVLTKNAWSLKLSLPEAMGEFREKAHTLREAEEDFQISEALQKNQVFAQHPDFAHLPEQEFVAFTHQTLNEAQSVRNLEILTPETRLIPFSNLFSREFFENNLEWDDSTKLDWLATRPAQMASLIYHELGLLHDSNHSQNSLVLVNEKGLPLKFVIRDEDFRLDEDHPKASSSKEQIPSGHFDRNAYLDYSMLNGMEKPISSQKSPLYLNFVFQFFYTFFRDYCKFTHQEFSPATVEKLISTFSIDESYSLLLTPRLISPNPIESRTHFKIRVSDYRHVESIKTGPSLSEVTERRQQLTNAAISRFQMRFNFLPESAQLNTELLGKILEQPGQTIGASSLQLNELELAFGDSATASSNQLIRDFMNDSMSEFSHPVTAKKSVLLKIIKAGNPEMFWNLCVFLRTLDPVAHSQFFTRFITESANAHAPPGVHFFFLSNSPWKSNPEIFEQLFAQYIEMGTENEMLLMLEKFTELRLFEKPERLSVYMRNASQKVLNLISKRLDHERKSGQQLLQKFSSQFQPFFPLENKARACLSTLH